MTTTRPRGPQPEHMEAFRRHRYAVMATLHPDGRPQLSLVQQHTHDGVVHVSLTARRVKTRNLRRDPRVALLIQPEGVESWVVAEGHAELSDISRRAGDEVGRALADLYESLAGPHPDWNDYLRAMVDDQRLLCHITVEHTYAGGG